MRKKILTLAVSTCVSALSYAGDMGPAVMDNHFRPFIIGEAAYSWPQITPTSINLGNGAHVSTTQYTQGWGGRLGAGMMKSVTERFAYSGEIGWAYHDHTNLDPFITYQGNSIYPSSKVATFGMDQYGFDILVGLFYTRPSYELFFKVGALAENMRSKMGVDMNLLMTNNSRASDFMPGADQVIHINVTQVMPEIKLGGNYHITENWLATASWMHAFGAKAGFFSNMLNFQSNQVLIGDVNLYLNNPTLNTVMFGFEYRFA